MSAEVKIFADSSAVAAGFAADFAELVQANGRENFTVALSGGSTPRILFERWTRQFADRIDWSLIHFFWGDERFVAPDDGDSNFGVAKSLFLDNISIPVANIHRALGESDPELERQRYEKEVLTHVEIGDVGLPRFDLVILGMGDDGHTASIFPHESQFLQSSRICEVATHPDTSQRRITLTGPVLNAAARVAFLITGSSKAGVLAQVINRSGDYDRYPASHVNVPDQCFYLDRAAASAL